MPNKYDVRPYENVVRRLAETFREMEVQSEYLSREGKGEGGGREIGGLLEIIREDLNNYNECMIPIGMSHFPPFCSFFSLARESAAKETQIRQQHSTPSSSLCGPNHQSSEHGTFPSRNAVSAI